MRWTEVTEEGFSGGPVMPDDYDGSPAAIEQLRLNIARAGIVGSFVGNDLRSSMIVVPLMDADARTAGHSTTRALLAQALDERAREASRRPTMSQSTSSASPSSSAT